MLTFFPQSFYLPSGLSPTLCALLSFSQYVFIILHMLGYGCIVYSLRSWSLHSQSSPLLLESITGCSCLHLGLGIVLSSSLLQRQHQMDDREAIYTECVLTGHSGKEGLELARASIVHAQLLLPEMNYKTKAQCVKACNECRSAHALQQHKNLQRRCPSLGRKC